MAERECVEFKLQLWDLFLLNNIEDLVLVYNLNIYLEYYTFLLNLYKSSIKY